MPNYWFDWTKFTPGIDVSHYQPLIDWKLLKAAGIKFVIAKATEGTSYVDDYYHKHCQGAYDADVMFGAYHFEDPTYYPWYTPERTPPEKDAQLQNFVKAAKNTKTYFTMTDHERWWEDYDQYLRALRGEITMSQVKHADKGWISRTGQELANRIKKIFQKEHIVYSSLQFISEHSPNSTAWVDNFLECTAYYPYNRESVVTDWATFWQKYEPPYPLVYGKESDGTPAKHSSPPWWANKAAEFWQYSGDKFKLPGITDTLKRPVALDMILYRGSYEQMCQKFGFVPKDVQPPVTPPEGGDPHLTEALQMLAELKVDLTESIAKVASIEQKLS